MSISIKILLHKVLLYFKTKSSSSSNNLSTFLSDDIKVHRYTELRFVIVTASSCLKVTPKFNITTRHAIYGTDYSFLFYL